MYRFYCNLILICLMTWCPSLNAKRSQFYRKDYTYLEQFDAFYKLQWNSNVVQWSSAFLTCDDEGAKLFYPKDTDEWKVAQSLAQNLTEPLNVTEIFVGLHDEFQLGEFITLDGHSTEKPIGLVDTSTLQRTCVLMDIASGVFRSDECDRSPGDPVPFICKKVDEESCPTIDHEYKFVKAANKCYKVHKKQKSWQHAMQTCYMEGGLLTVLETNAEINNIRHLIANDATYYIGFKRMYNTDFYTVKGKIFENTYFDNWYSGETTTGKECGTYLYFSYNQQNRIQAANCQELHQFICEMDINRI